MVVGGRSDKLRRGRQARRFPCAPQQRARSAPRGQGGRNSSETPSIFAGDPAGNETSECGSGSQCSRLTSPHYPGLLFGQEDHSIETTTGVLVLVFLLKFQTLEIKVEAAERLYLDPKLKPKAAKHMPTKVVVFFVSSFCFCHLRAVAIH
jgi:hypothetical protein